jgi:lipopolysaccharide biosynthesis protein
MNLRAKIIAMYFTQLHAIPENDKWWGKGFTDWVNVKKALPQYEGHYQPRIPLDGNYYDQSEINTIRWQVDLARQYGIYGFCHYHYWFDGRQLLETPTNLMLSNKEIDFPFCLSWANETWSKRWDGREDHILIKQTHPPAKERWKLHFDYLIKAWTDDRAIKVDGKPVFVIYRPHKIPEIKNMLEYWRELATQRGLDGLYFIAQKQYEFPSRGCLSGFDAAFQFQPFEALNHPDSGINDSRFSYAINLARKLPASLQNILHVLREKIFNGLTIYDYDLVWSEIVKIRTEEDLTLYPGAFVDWDNTARYKERATIYKGASPEKFNKWFSLLVDSMRQRNLPEKFIFINAWNEWAEGAYLEPDKRYGYEYLELIKQILLPKNL